MSFPPSTIYTSPYGEANANGSALLLALACRRHDRRYANSASHPPSTIPMLLRSKFTITNHQMPLAVYREVAAHLQQLEGITVSFLTTVDRGFSYTESQIGGIEISGADRLTAPDQIRIDDVLNYYADRYSCWEIAD